VRRGRNATGLSEGGSRATERQRGLREPPEERRWRLKRITVLLVAAEGCWSFSPGWRWWKLLG
jgi:hypothetical protein